MEVEMERATIQDWTLSKVPMKVGDYREVEYRVYRDGDKHYQVKLDRGSYEVLLRYVLVDVVAA
jgi:hypothetical protein